MGMKLKPSKCRSFSVTGGKACDVPFYIGDYTIPSIKNEEQKFLGKILFFTGKQEETFSLIFNSFLEGLERINKSMVRNEFKLWIYSNYFLPSKRFLLTVHNLTTTSLEKLDRLSDKYVKQWAGLPPSATNALLHMPVGMGFKSISEMYMEVHTVSHTRTRLKGDTIVNSVVSSTLEREGEYIRKKSTTCEAEATFNTIINQITHDSTIPTFTGENGTHLKHQFDTKVRNEAKKHLSVVNNEKWCEHVKSLSVQGNFLAMAAAEKQDIVWKSSMFNLKQGTLKFLLNASIDTLPTAANLKRWKKASSDLCKLCKRRQTTNHVLSACPVALDQKRYTWRHDSVISYIVNIVDPKFTVFSDIPGHNAPGGGSIPPELCVTVQKPDIVILNKEKKEIHLFELTCPSEANIEHWHREKNNKYAHFISDCTGYKCTVQCFEVSTKGFLTTRNHTTLKTLHKFMQPHHTLNNFKQNIAAISLIASHQIFISRSDPTFSAPPYILPPIKTPTSRGQARRQG